MKHGCAAWHNQYFSALLGNYQGLGAHVWGAATLPAGTEMCQPLPCTAASVGQLGNRLGTSLGWDKAVIIPPSTGQATPGTLCWVWLYRKGLGQGPEKEPRDGPRWGKAESPGFVQPGEKNIITHSGLAAEVEIPLDRR